MGKPDVNPNFEKEEIHMGIKDLFKIDKSMGESRIAQISGIIIFIGLIVFAVFYKIS